MTNKKQSLRVLFAFLSIVFLLGSFVDTRTIYIMPKLNPDGSDHYLTKPDGMRSSVRPYDSDHDGLLDEDPREDLDRDGYITHP